MPSTRSLKKRSKKVRAALVPTVDSTVLIHQCFFIAQFPTCKKKSLPRKKIRQRRRFTYFRLSDKNNSYIGARSAKILVFYDIKINFLMKFTFSEVLKLFYWTLCIPTFPEFSRISPNFFHILNFFPHFPKSQRAKRFFARLM